MTKLEKADAKRLRKAKKRNLDHMNHLFHAAFAKIYPTFKRYKRHPSTVALDLLKLVDRLRNGDEFKIVWIDEK